MFECFLWTEAESDLAAVMVVTLHFLCREGRIKNLRRRRRRVSREPLHDYVSGVARSFPMLGFWQEGSVGRQCSDGRTQKYGSGHCSSAPINDNRNLSSFSSHTTVCHPSHPFASKAPRVFQIGSSRLSKRVKNEGQTKIRNSIGQKCVRLTPGYFGFLTSWLPISHYW